jgi:hypothetical protein
LINKSVLGVILVSVMAVSNLLAGCINEQSSDNKTIIDISPFDTTIPAPVTAQGDTFWWEPVFVVQPGSVDIPVSDPVVVGIATDDEDGELRVEVGTDPAFGPNVPKIEIKVRDLERTGNNEYRFTWNRTLEYATVYYCRAKLITKNGETDWVTSNFTTEAKPLPGQ